MNRRTFVGSAALGMASTCLPHHIFAQQDDFATLWSELQSKPDLVQEALFYRDFALEGDGVDCLNILKDGQVICIVTAAKRPPRLKPSDLEISKDAQELIIFYEVTNRAKYERELQKPIWPGESSGITIGFGYDLGYVSRSDFQEEWKNLIHPFAIEALSSVCGLKGTSAQTALATVSSVRVDWHSAQKQFSEVLLPIFIAQTEKFLPNLSKLHQDCRGALVSLIFNRGTALTIKNDNQDTRKEIREIKALMEAEKFDAIPGKFLEMTRIWEGRPKSRGVILRRRAEAALFERGLSA